MKPSKYTAAQKVEHAELALQKQDIDTARECMRDAAELAPHDVEIMDAYGALLAEHGPAEEAINALQQAVTLCPDRGHEKYMYLGQLLEGSDSIKQLENGIRILRSEPGQAVKGKQKQVLSEALCSLAEAHMNYNDVAEVETMVEELLQEAQRLAPSPEPLQSRPDGALRFLRNALQVVAAAPGGDLNPRVRQPQALASLRVEQGRPDEAMHFLHKSMALWYVPHPDSELAAKKDAPYVFRSGAQPPAQPSYEFRLESVKLLLELEETINTAVEVLEDLIEEDDRVMETWYLLAMALHAGGEHAEAQTAVERGLALARTLGMPADDPLLLAFQDTQRDILKALEDAGHDSL